MATFLPNPLFGGNIGFVSYAEGRIAPAGGQAPSRPCPLTDVRLATDLAHHV